MLLTKAAAFGSQSLKKGTGVKGSGVSAEALTRTVKVFTKQQAIDANRRMEIGEAFREPRENAKRKRDPSPTREPTGRTVRPAGLMSMLKATQRKRERARARQKKFTSRLRATVGELSILEVSSVKTSTRQDYLNKLRGFYEFTAFHQLETRDEAQLDKALCDYADVQYLNGEDSNFGQKLLAALEFQRPEAAREGRLQVTRFRRALKGWRRMAPTQTRLPLPEFMKSSISAVMIRLGSEEMALFNEVSFSTYARPGELFRMKAADFVPHNRDYHHSVLVVAPFERGEGSKAGVFDEVLILDDVRAPWLEPLLRAHVESRLAVSEEANLWSFNAKAFLEVWRIAVDILGIGDVALSPYQNRHGGASRDHLLRLRSVVGIQCQRRGRWAVDTSARIYDKPGRLQQVLNKHGTLLQDFGEMIRKDFRRYFRGQSFLLPRKLEGKLAQAQKARAC